MRDRIAAGTVADADDMTGTVAFLLPRSWQRGGATRSYTTTAIASIQPGHDPGDGTVHAGSGLRVPSSIEAELTVNSSGVSSGYTHDGAYNDTYARRQVAKWVSDMVLFQLGERGLV